MSRASLLSLLLAALSTFGAAGCSTAPPGAQTISTQAQFFAMGDMNGDGSPDLVVTWPETGMSLWLNHGDGTFDPPKTLNKLLGSYSQHALVDMNGDGALDIVFTFFDTTDRMVVVTNLGDGTFQAPVIRDMNAHVPAFVVDLDGDDRPDLVGWSSDHLTVWRNVGAGTFGAPVSQPLDVGSKVDFVGDLDGDGKPDVVVDGLVGGQELVRAWMNDGHGSFGNPASCAMDGPPYTYGTVNVSAVDLDGDGKPDLVAEVDGTTGGEPPGVHYALNVWLAQGEGSFAPLVAYDLPGLPTGMAIADVNGDGHADILAATGDSFSVLLNQGDGSFAAPVSYALASVVAQMSMIAVNDMNGDGAPDVVLDKGDALLILFNRGDGTFTLPGAAP